MKAHIVSLGCPKNLVDTEAIMTRLANEGYTFTRDPSQASLILVNTCAFIKPARDEAIATLKKMARWKKRGKCRHLIAAGCLPQKSRHDLPGILPEVDAFIGTPQEFSRARIKATSPWYAYVKIAEGCANHCAYCLIPKIRGRLKFRNRKDILDEARFLAQNGVKEIIFIAQDTAVYPRLDLLLKNTAKIRNIRWIRLMYLHPAHVTDRLIDAIAKEPKAVKYFDLPIQHAHDKILARMNRRCRRRELEALISKIRRKVPGAVIRTSVIVGFPGEGETEFNKLLDFVKKVKFDRLGAFTFWKEEGTPAAKMRGQVSEEVKARRIKKVMRAQSLIARERNVKLIGKTLETIIEGPDFGRSRMDAPEIDGKVFIKNSRSLKPGEIVSVKITGAATYDLIGVLA